MKNSPYLNRLPAPPFDEEAARRERSAQALLADYMQTFAEFTDQKHRLKGVSEQSQLAANPTLNASAKNEIEENNNGQ
jgi:hypothetical protein